MRVHRSLLFIPARRRSRAHTGLGPFRGAADATWPRELQTDVGVLTIYQPQPEKFEDNILEGAAPLSMLMKG